MNEKIPRIIAREGWDDISNDGSALIGGGSSDIFKDLNPIAI